MSNHFEDTDPDLLDVEETLLRGFSSARHLNQLRKKLLGAVLSKSVSHAQVRAVVSEAVKREPGVMIRQIFTEDLDGVTFESKRRTIDIDEDLKPYYGHVRNALRELQSFGVDRQVTDMWLTYFLKDNAVYRVNTVASMVVSASLMCHGKDTRLGEPTKIALAEVHT